MASRILMVSPTHFGYNLETAEDNYFQQQSKEDISIIRERAQQEFEEAVGTIRKLGIEVFVHSASGGSADAVFPNNWISFHDSSYVLYPMRSEMRRSEVDLSVLKTIGAEEYQCLDDFQNYTTRGIFLEGTGSLVLDSKNRKAYAAVSPRTDLGLAQRWAEKLNYELIAFHATDRNAQAIYHTNVMMSIGSKTCILTVDSLRNELEREFVIESIEQNHEIVRVDFDQMEAFAGNAILLEEEDSNHWIMSKKCEALLSNSQMKQLQIDGPIEFISIPTIESIGGGSIRCMICTLD